jgi:hypothetical protein
MRILAAFVVVSLAVFATGCLQVALVDASVRKPSNVAVYFSVTDAQHRPVPGMRADQFKIKEDGKVVSAFESKQTILNPEVSVVQYTLLLMDMSGSVTGSGQVGELTEAASVFAEKVSTSQQVAVYAFDGGKDLHPIVGFTSGAGLRNSIAALASYKPRDPSTNLNGAVIEGLHLLQAQMERATQPIRFGTLVVFTDGSDHAHRVSHERVMEALDQVGTTMNVYVIGVGAEIDFGELSAIGRTRSILSKNPAVMRKAFEDLAQIVADYAHTFYLLSYCSPARAGEHEVEIEAHPPGRPSGSLAYHFNASGFQPGCDPNTPPAFDVHHPHVPTKKK